MEAKMAQKKEKWTAQELIDTMEPTYTLQELWKISKKKMDVNPRTIGRAANRLGDRGEIDYSYKDKRKARINPRDGAKILNEVNLSSGNPDWIKKE
jgi:hypothetical protein